MAVWHHCLGRNKSSLGRRKEERGWREVNNIKIKNQKIKNKRKWRLYPDNSFVVPRQLKKRKGEWLSGTAAPA